MQAESGQRTVQQPYRLAETASVHRRDAVGQQPPGNDQIRPFGPSAAAESEISAMAGPGAIGSAGGRGKSSVRSTSYARVTAAAAGSPALVSAKVWCSSRAWAAAPAITGAAKDVPLQVPNPVNRSGSRLARQLATGRWPSGPSPRSTDGRSPTSTFGMVLTRAAPGQWQEIQGPSLLNSATLPSGLRAATLTSGASCLAPAKVPALNEANPAGSSGRLLALLPAAATTMIPTSARESSAFLSRLS